jgi:glycosyltransferase involved in cell wall biosynthesis
MEKTTFDPEFVGSTSQAMNEMAKDLLRDGNVDFARLLIQHAAKLELLSPELQICWGGPFNGQTGRIAIVDELLAVLKPRAVIETGTYRGISTLWFARNFDGPVWSCETEELYLIQARHRLRDCSNVYLEHADSRHFLKRLIPKFDSNAPLLFYLDAHWELNLPLREELQIIFATHSKAVAIVDDFRIPDDSGYGWDNYGPGIRVDAGQLFGAIPDGSSIYFPRLSSADESGARRGCCVIAFRSSEAVNACRLLRRQSLSEAVSAGERQDTFSTDSIVNSAISVHRDQASARSETRMVTDLRKELIKLNIDRTLRLRAMRGLQKQLSVNEADRERCLDDIKFLTGKNQRQLQALKTFEDDNKFLRQQIEDLTEFVKRLTDEFSLEPFDRTSLTRLASRVFRRRQSEPSNEASLIRLAYRIFLNREPEPEVLAERVKRLEADLRLRDIVTEIAKSDESVTRMRNLSQSRQGKEEQASIWRAAIAFTYAHFLKRQASEEEITGQLRGLEGGIPLESFIQSVANSDEAKFKAAEAELSHGELVSIWRAAIASTYAHFLKRQPSEEEIMEWQLRGLEGGISLESFIQSVANSDEAKFKATEAKGRPELSDGEFMVSVGQFLYGRGLNPLEVVMGQKALNGDSALRHQFVSNMIDEQVRKLLQTEKAGASVYDPGNCWIMGTTKFLTRQLWEERARQITGCSDQEMRPPLSDRRFTHNGSFKVSMIASLYKGRDYICNFLENITSQSAFDNSELIIVDANSPEQEWEVIEKYQKVYDNIVYKRLNYRISVYQAWNLGVELARGCYLTNTNLDDLRRSNSIELQAALLDQNADVDVVYQDVYYSFDANLSFDAVAAYGFKTELPIITPHNMLQFNSPHNAPMWRKNLHDELGLFDTRYKSAGDYEFWVRCVVAGKNFRKINTPHVVYYQNPKGISTEPNTRGLEEFHDVLRRYSRKLMSRTLLLSRRDFYAELGLNEEEAAVLEDLSYYDVAQRELVRLGSRRPEV